MNTNTRMYHWKSPLGMLEIGISDQYVCSIKFTNTKVEQIDDNPVLQECMRQLTEFFRGKRTSFDLPLNPAGTDFQKAVWQATATIPHGETRSYGDIARMINRPLASRAVGQALNKNPICIIVPCHRVVSSSGGLGGFAWGSRLKRNLLSREEGVAG